MIEKGFLMTYYVVNITYKKEIKYYYTKKKEIKIVKYVICLCRYISIQMTFDQPYIILV